MNNNKYSNLKIAWFPEKLQSMRKKELTSPIYVRIKPTNKCCHSCYFCVYHHDFSNMHDSMNMVDEIPLQKMIEILENLKEIGVKAITYSGGGEPLVHPNIVEIMNKTIDCGIDLSMLTNGQLLQGDRAACLSRSKWVRISMDYWNKDMFFSTREGSTKMFNQLVDNVTSFANNKGTCDVGINYIITQENHDTLEEAFFFLKKLNVDTIRFSPLWVPNFYEYHGKIKTQVIKQLSKISKQMGNVSIYNSYNIIPDVNTRSYETCYWSEVNPVIGADCVVYRCHNKAYDNLGAIGSIKNKKFSELWFSDETKAHFKTFNPCSSCNHQCTNDKKNIHINEILTCYGDNYV